MRFSKSKRGEEVSSDSGYGYLGESSKQAERRLKYSSKNHMKFKSCSKSSTYTKNNVYKNSFYKSTNSPNFLRKQRQLSRSTSDKYGVIRNKRFWDQRDILHKKDHKRRKMHNGAIFVEDSDYLMYLKSLTGDKEKDKDKSDTVSEIESEEDYDDVVDDDDEENVDIPVDMDRDMDMNMGGNWIGVGNELNLDDRNEENIEENQDVQVDINMGGDSGDAIDVGDEQEDPEYKMFFENLRKDGKSYILEMESEKKGEFVSIKYEEPLLPPSCSKGKSMPDNGFHPFLDECKPLKSTAEERYITYLKNIGVIGGSLFVITDDIILPVNEKHNQVTPSVPGKSSKDGFPCGKDLQFEQDNREIVSDPVKSVKDGLGYCKDPAKKPPKPQKSCHSQMDEDDLGTDCPRLEFEKRLEKCINMPYDAKELNDKWELASHRNEVERVRETRGRSVSYATEQTSRSYLDHHPALAEMVDCALARCDGCRALLLLRCLFFYNENVAHEGAFMPWKDPSFERVLLDSA